MTVYLGIQLAHMLRRLGSICAQSATSASQCAVHSINRIKNIPNQNPIEQTEENDSNDSVARVQCNDKLARELNDWKKLFLIEVLACFRYLSSVDSKFNCHSCLLFALLPIDLMCNNQYPWHCTLAAGMDFARFQLNDVILFEHCIMWLLIVRCVLHTIKCTSIESMLHKLAIFFSFAPFYAVKRSGYIRLNRMHINKFFDLISILFCCIVLDQLRLGSILLVATAASCNEQQLCNFSLLRVSVSICRPPARLHACPPATRTCVAGHIMVI